MADAYHIHFAQMKDTIRDICIRRPDSLDLGNVGDFRWAHSNSLSRTRSPPSLFAPLLYGDDDLVADLDLPVFFQGGIDLLKRFN